MMPTDEILFCDTCEKEVTGEELAYCKNLKHVLITTTSTIQKQNNRFCYDKRDNIVTKTILDHNIQVLRPQTLLKDKTKMILVYLPTQQEISKDSPKGTKLISKDFNNTAYFVSCKEDDEGNLIKRIIPYDEPHLTENFKVEVLPIWNDTRWDINLLSNWLKEKQKFNPKELYEILTETTKKYIQFVDDYDYTHFNLWNITTYCFELFDAFPINDFTGTKRSGKTKALMLQSKVCFNAVMSPDMTSSTTFRLAQGMGATILFDETEQFKNKKDENAQKLRTLIIQGYLKNSYALRAASKESDFVPVPYNLYCPKSMAHISGIDDVLEDRCIPKLMRRPKQIDKKIMDSWPNGYDLNFEKIRSLCYRLFLEYGNEIKKFEYSAIQILDLSSRELQLWGPLMTMALFFEKHGITGLIEDIKKASKISSQQRQISDEEENLDLAVLRFVDDKVLPKSEEISKEKNNPLSWMPISEIYKILAEYSSDYGINTEYFPQRKLTETLKRLGFKRERKQAGYSWLITLGIVSDVKERMGIKDTIDEVSKIDDEKKASNFFCITCDAGPFNINEESRSSGNILEFHRKLGHNIEYITKP